MYLLCEIVCLSACIAQNVCLRLYDLFFLLFFVILRSCACAVLFVCIFMSARRRIFQ